MLLLFLLKGNAFFKMRNIFKGFPLFQVENPEKKLRKKKAKIVTHDHLINCVNFNLMGGPH